MHMELGRCWYRLTLGPGPRVSGYGRPWRSRLAPWRSRLAQAIRENSSTKRADAVEDLVAAIELELRKTLKSLAKGHLLLTRKEGETIWVVPHITDAIQEWIERVGVIPVDGKDGPPDVCVIELGGTIGDIESMPFIEALGQFSRRDQKAHEAILKQLNLLGVPKEPILEEWTSRAQLCDMLHDPSELPLLENIQAFQMLISLY
ncbi:hypothetical protein AAC387_Pa05g3430 [Persea americana]